jgi:type I restriction enzyme M protein
MVSRVHRDLTTEDIGRIADTFHAWRGEPGARNYAEAPGFCSSAKAEEVAEHRFVLTPGRYVGAEDTVAGDEPSAEKIARLTKELEDAFTRSTDLQQRVHDALGRLDV